MCWQCRVQAEIAGESVNKIAIKQGKEANAYPCLTEKTDGVVGEES